MKELLKTSRISIDQYTLIEKSPNRDTPIEHSLECCKTIQYLVSVQKQMKEF